MLLLWGTCLNTSVPATSSTRSTYPTLWFPGGPILPSPRAPPSSFPSAPMSLQLPSSLHQEALAVKPQRLSPLGLGEELRTPRALPLTSLHLRGVPGGSQWGSQVRRRGSNTLLSLARSGRGVKKAEILREPKSGLPPPHQAWKERGRWQFWFLGATVPGGGMSAEGMFKPMDQEQSVSS